MTHIILQNVQLNYPIRANRNSLRKELIKSTFGKNIKVNYVEALTNINLEIYEGVYGLYGPNGSGKTTLLKIFSKIFEPSSGNVNISGSISSLINIHFGFNEELTGIENIITKLIIQKTPKSKIKDLSVKISHDTQLDNYLDLPLKTYSSGMKFRLAFFISKYLESDILLMDEWIAVGDQALRDTVDNIIKDKISKSKITVIASHNLDRLKKVCKKIIYLEDGKIIKII
jgi:lipopolysaccharide transport system ATP-binding protein